MPYPENLSLHTIWEEIVHFIDSTKDLLSLALTCHTFKELIIPDHLHYRNLSIDIRMTNVWELLEHRPRLARNVRSIKLSNITETERLPPPLSNLAVIFSCDVPVTDTDMAFFKRAVSHMPLLKEFSWGNLDGVSPEQVIDISHTLTASAPYLEGLDVDILDLIWSLTSLKRVVLRTIRAQFTSLDAIQMILSCPNIEDLYSQATSHPDTFPFYMMQQANWTKLRRLEFQPLSVSNEEERDTNISAIITSFFVRHSNIECLSFYTLPRIALFGLAPSSLPKLHSLSSNLDVMTSLLPTSVISRLVHLVCRVGQIDLNTLPQMDRLESVQLSGKRNGSGLIHPFLSKAPNLKKVSLSIRGLWVTSPIKLRNQDIQEQYIEPFLKYPQSKLTHIYMDTPLSLIAVDRDSLNLQIGAYCQKLSVLRDLKYIGFSPEYVELKRDENGTYFGYRPIPYKEAINIFSWGGFFSNLSH
ncbi:hypothetical protein Clacol_010452 [Clathrus columnatus]|uniref:F-box domain-containing protein n=1 Tax=Clathrus columnatus TaxID=1419009 RepID=A0AAV5ANB7_9AGAM|nr:hypothetical protein Clacol_010452 [Clathrus columnatus]